MDIACDQCDAETLQEIIAEGHDEYTSEMVEVKVRPSRWLDFLSRILYDTDHG